MTETGAHYDVVVIGAGPTGLVLANILGMHGVATLLVERNPATVGEPRAVSIDDESLRTLQYLGLFDAARRASSKATAPTITPRAADASPKWCRRSSSTAIRGAPRSASRPATRA